MKYQKTLDSGKIPLDDFNIRERLKKQDEIAEKMFEDDPDSERWLSPTISDKEWSEFIGMLHDQFFFRIMKGTEFSIQLLFDLCKKIAHVATGFRYAHLQSFVLGRR